MTKALVRLPVNTVQVKEATEATVLDTDVQSENGICEDRSNGSQPSLLGTPGEAVRLIAVSRPSERRRLKLRQLVLKFKLRKTTK
jgi:hypothetical protein